MAGMLPGVEFARKRCLRQGGATRSRSLFSLHSTETTHLTVHSTFHHGCTLGGIAREAKERLDEKLRNPRAVIKRHNSMSSMRPINDNNGVGNLQREVYNSSKTGMRKFMNWSKLGWKASEQSTECVVCLDEFRTGDVLVHLPCAHRFHSNCVMPWIESSSQCPVCRTNILSSST